MKVITLFAAGCLCLVGVMTAYLPNPGRQEFNVCRACSKILKKEIEKTVIYLRASSRCLEINHEMGEILPASHDTEVTVTTRSELLAKIQRYILEVQMIRDVWAANTRRDFCLPNAFGKQLTKVLCILSSTEQRKQNRTISNYFPIPSDFPSILNYAATFTRDVYVTMTGFNPICECVPL